ncbi:hypothetical protein ACIXWW_23780, partial [Bacteroides fragilis]
YGRRVYKLPVGPSTGKKQLPYFPRRSFNETVFHLWRVVLSSPVLPQNFKSGREGLFHLQF